MIEFKLIMRNENSIMLSIVLSPSTNWSPRYTLKELFYLHIISHNNLVQFCSAEINHFNIFSEFSRFVYMAARDQTGD